VVERSRQEWWQKVLRPYAEQAVKILEGKKASRIRRWGTEVVWNDGNLRTLVIRPYIEQPLIVRLHVDDMSVFPPRSNAVLSSELRGSKNEVSVLSDEVGLALVWVLSYDPREEQAVPEPPFEYTTPRSGLWSYVWSKRASETYSQSQKQRARR